MGILQDAAGRFLRRNSEPPTGAVPGNAAHQLAEQMLHEEFGEDTAAPPSRYSLVMLSALQGKTVYQGTVPAHVTARRRAKNKLARKTRRLSRLRAR